MKPKNILFFVVAVLCSLLGLTFVSRDYIVSPSVVSDSEVGESLTAAPLEEIKQGFPFGNTHVKYPTFEKLTQIKKAIPNEKAAEILRHKALSSQQMQEDFVEIDSIPSESTKGSLPLISNIEGKIYYPGNPEEFVSKLHQKLSQHSCRIIHFGASKIEGDRITSYIRNRLQVIYGGTGPGYFPIKMPYPQKSIDLQISENWDRYALFNGEHRRTKHLLPTNQYGLYANVCRFTPIADTDTINIKKAFFEIKPSYNFFKRLRQYSVMGIHYGNCKTPTAISVYENGKLIKQDSLKSDGKYHNYKVKFARTPNQIRVEFSSRISPDFYGITLDGNSGVFMDNVPTRGDSGLHFTKLQNTFDAMSRELQPDIFFFEFGGNLIPSLKTEDQVRSSVKRIINNIEWVRRRNPNALCVLIGPSDMLRPDTQVSYSIIPTLVAEMKKQALHKGIAFWSMYEAMGGENSMKVWFDKGFGSTDFIHFTQSGTDKISELLYNELEANLLAVQKTDSIQ